MVWQGSAEPAQEAGAARATSSEPRCGLGGFHGSSCARTCSFEHRSFYELERESTGETGVPGSGAGRFSGDRAHAFPAGSRYWPALGTAAGGRRIGGGGNAVDLKTDIRRQSAAGICVAANAGRFRDESSYPQRVSFHLPDRRVHPKPAVGCDHFRECGPDRMGSARNIAATETAARKGSGPIAVFSTTTRVNRAHPGEYK